jgi:hypothetical protein
MKDIKSFCKLFDLKDNFDFGNQSQMINYWDELWGEK